MDSLIKVVFKVLGTLMLSLLIYGAVFGGSGRTAMWKGVDSIMQSSWRRYTMYDKDNTTVNSDSNGNKGHENSRTQGYNRLWDSVNGI